MKPVLVYGASRFGHVVRDLVIDCGKRFEGFVDDWVRGPEILGPGEVIGRSTLPDECEIALAIGYKHLRARLELFDRLKTAGFSIATLVHPAAYVARSATVGEGVLVMARAIVDTAATVQDLAVLWPGANVSHNSEVGRNSFLSPGAVLCGCSRIGASCFIGAGAVITDHVDVPAESFVKAASCYAGDDLRAWNSSH